MLNDRGFSLQTVGWVLSTYTAVSAVFTVVGGYIGDRVPVRIALFAFSVLQSAAVVVLLLAHTVALAFVFAVLLGIGFGGRNPLPHLYAAFILAERPLPASRVFL
jgi:MFS family permease